MEWRVTLQYVVDTRKEAPNVLAAKLRKLDDQLDVANDPAGSTARNISVTVPGNTAAQAEAKAREVLNEVGGDEDLVLVETVIEGTAEEVPETEPPRALPEGETKDRPEILEAEVVSLEEPDDSR
jgi:hypothetical protein